MHRIQNLLNLSQSLKIKTKDNTCLTILDDSDYFGRVSTANCDSLEDSWIIRNVKITEPDSRNFNIINKT